MTSGSVFAVFFFFDISYIIASKALSYLIKGKTIFLTLIDSPLYMQKSPASRGTDSTPIMVGFGHFSTSFIFSQISILMN